jgi:hypothetical protein
MSFLVEMPRHEYPGDALDGFRVASDFDVDNARAMMWLSQIAYETAFEQKIRDVLGSWDLIGREIIFNPPDVSPLHKTACAVVVGGRNATVVAFAGTDPLKINDWITDFRASRSPNDLHMGFEKAIERIWPRVKAAIAARPAAEKDLFFTGHSLGGALAIIAAHRALRDSDLEVRATAVYTFGSPRPGGGAFFESYTPALGDVTYRLVHGTDLVATVPPSANGLFRHVGRCVQCGSGCQFDRQTPVFLASDDKPAFVESLSGGVRNSLRALTGGGRLFAPIGPGWLGRFFGILPRQIQDHIPRSYFATLPSSGVVN